MKTSPVTFDDLAASVISVPPLARNDDYSLNRDANERLVRSLEQGGVTSLMYGGNANFYHLPLHRLPETLDMLEEIAAPDTWVLPSVGADYGRMMDALPVLKARSYPTVMVLPAAFPTTIRGVERGIREFSDAFGKPVVIYLKREGYLDADSVERLVSDGHVAAIKYAVVRDNPSVDGLLTELCERIDRRYLVSGIGERPVVEHFRDFGLSSFTSGSVCLAPGLCTKLRRALASDDFSAARRLVSHFIPIEDLRDAISPMRVLHRAVTEGGVASMGALMPLVDSELAADQRAAVRAAARNLVEQEARIANSAIA
jgi:dihydrodipicolinate synthase/N-acetylneuraminate lyase